MRRIKVVKKEGADARSEERAVIYHGAAICCGCHLLWRSWHLLWRNRYVLWCRVVVMCCLLGDMCFNAAL